jgi:hypothetical protein
VYGVWMNGYPGVITDWTSQDMAKCLRKNKSAASHGTEYAWESDWYRRVVSFRRVLAYNMICTRHGAFSVTT